MAWHIELVVTLVVAIFASGGFWQWLMNRSDKRKNDSKLLLGLAYSRLIDECEKHIGEGYICSDDYHELKHYLYEPYEANGGNGTAKRLMEEVDKLPIRNPEKFPVENFEKTK